MTLNLISFIVQVFKKNEIAWIFQMFCFPAGLLAEPSQGPVRVLQQWHKQQCRPKRSFRTVRKCIRITLFKGTLSSINEEYAEQMCNFAQLAKTLQVPLLMSCHVTDWCGKVTLFTKVGSNWWCLCIQTCSSYHVRKASPHWVIRVTEWLANHGEVGCWSKARRLMEHERLNQRNTHFARPVLLNKEVFFVFTIQTLFVVGGQPPIWLYYINSYKPHEFECKAPVSLHTWLE